MSARSLPLLLMTVFLMVYSPKLVRCQQVYKVKRGEVQFHSEAAGELIRAYTDQLTGSVDLTRRIFSVRIKISTFLGFNNPLQQEHFNENYMESAAFPYATYTGKIIEELDLAKDGEYNVRTKGKLSIHGVEHECIIKAAITSKNGKITVHSDFFVLLADYNIKVPRIVNDKVASEIKVSVKAELAPSVSS